MPSTYTNNSGIEKPGSGEQAGTWGATSNNNFDIIDRALNGVCVITLAGTSHTLTTTDGTLSDGQYKVLVIGGTPSGTNTITISPNDQDKIYLAKNNTAQSVVFTQGSGEMLQFPAVPQKLFTQMAQAQALLLRILAVTSPLLEPLTQPHLLFLECL